MSDTIGTVTVPDLTPSGTFPLVTDYPHGRSIEPLVKIHKFIGANEKIEQRFLLGAGLRKWRASWAALTAEERDSLFNFWDSRKGPYQPFTYPTPNEDGTTTDRICQFEDAPLEFESFVDRVETGITFIEVTLAENAPSYSVNATLDRFPDSTLQTAMLGQVQRFVELLYIQPRDPDYPAMYFSRRRCTVGGQLYQARLLNWAGIGQRLDGSADDARFTLGNADRVMRDVANSTDLYKAKVVFSLYHIGTQIQVDVWTGQLRDFVATSRTEFDISAADKLSDLGLQYPIDRLTNSCWKQQAGKYNDGEVCPFGVTGNGHTADTLDLVNFPSADASFCDGGRITPNGCKAHTMKWFYGGLQLDPQTVRVKDNSTGFFGAGRLNATATSQVADSLMNLPVREIYTQTPMVINCQIAAGRDEGDFYEALGIVGGAIDSFGAGTLDSAGNIRVHTLDGQPDASFPTNFGREYPGRDPAFLTDYFSLDQSGDQRKGDPDKAYSGNSTVQDSFAAGISFIVIRRTDEKGFQLTTLDTHAMQAVVGRGMRGWVWTAPGERTEQVLTNPIWVAANVYLRGIGLRKGTLEEAEAEVNIPAAVAAASICNLTVDKIVGSGTETQFVLEGVIEDIKALKDWLQEILNTALASYYMSNGKLTIFCREDAAAAHSFSGGNMLSDSLQLRPKKPAFNRLSMTFANSDYEFVKDGVPIPAVDHIKYLGQTIDGYMNLLSSSKSRAGRIGAARLKEELGGATLEEWRKARTAQWSSTVLALGVPLGIGISIDDDEVPDGTGLFRVTGWDLNPDLSLDFLGDTITDSMYDQIAGPKLDDVPANGVQVEFFPEPLKSVWCPNYASPPADDALYSAYDRTFGLAFQFNQLADAQQALVRIIGERAMNSPKVDTQPPIIRNQGLSTTGGSLPGNRNYYVRIYARDSDGNYTPGSNIRHFTFDGVMTDDNWIRIYEIDWPAGAWVDAVVFAGDDEKNICWQIFVSESSSMPTDIILDSFKEATFNAPSPQHKKVLIKVKEGLHFGNVGLPIDVIDSGTGVITIGTLIGYTGDLVGRWMFVFSDVTDNFQEPVHYAVTVFDPYTGEFEVTPDPIAHGVKAGDLITFRLIPEIFLDDGYVIGDSQIANTQYPDGATNPEIGEIIRGVTPGQPHQLRYVASRPSNVSYRVDKPFDYAPTYWVVEKAGWTYRSESTSVPVPRAGNLMIIETRIDNLVDKPITVGAFMIDARGNETPEEFAVIREGFCIGKPGIGGGFNSVISFTWEGTIGIKSDIGQPTSLLQPATATAVRVAVSTEPIGADIVIEIRLGATLWATVTIPDGSSFTELSVDEIAALAIIPNDVNIRVDIVAVGTTYPGGDLSIRIYL